MHTFKPTHRVGPEPVMSVPMGIENTFNLFTKFDLDRDDDHSMYVLHQGRLLCWGMPSQQEVTPL